MLSLHRVALRNSTLLLIVQTVCQSRFLIIVLHQTFYEDERACNDINGKCEYRHSYYHVTLVFSPIRFNIVKAFLNFEKSYKRKSYFYFQTVYFGLSILIIR